MVLELYGGGDDLDIDSGSGDIPSSDGADGDVRETTVIVRISFALDYTAADMDQLMTSVMEQLTELLVNPARVLVEYGSSLQGASEPGTTVVAIHLRDYTDVRDVLETLSAGNFTVVHANETYVGWIAGQSSQMPSTENNDPGVGESVVVADTVEWWRDPYFTVPVGSVLFALFLLCAVHKLSKANQRRSIRLKPAKLKGTAVLLSQSPKAKSAKRTAVPDGIEELQHDQLQRDLAASTRTPPDTITRSKPTLIGNDGPGSQRSMSLASSSGSSNSPIQLRPDAIKNVRGPKLQRDWENPYTLASPLNPDGLHKGVTSNGRLFRNGHMLQSFHKGWRGDGTEADYDMAAPADAGADNTAAGEGRTSNGDMLYEIGASRRDLDAEQNYDMAVAEAAEEFEQSYEMARARASRSSLLGVPRDQKRDYDIALPDNAIEDDYEMAMTILENTKPEIPDEHQNHRFSVDSADHDPHHEAAYEYAAPVPEPWAAENDYTLAAPIPTDGHRRHRDHHRPGRENDYDLAAPVPAAQHADAYATPIATAEKRETVSEYATARGVVLRQEPPKDRCTIGAPRYPSAGDKYGIAPPLPARDSTASDDTEHPFMSFASSVAEAETGCSGGELGDPDIGGSRWATPSKRSAPKMTSAVIVAPAISPRINMPPPPKWADDGNKRIGSVRRATIDMNATKRKLDTLFGGKDVIKPLPPKAPRSHPTGTGWPQESVAVLPLNISQSPHSVQASINIDEALSKFESIFGNSARAPPLPNYCRVETDL